MGKFQYQISRKVSITSFPQKADKPLWAYLKTFTYMAIQILDTSKAYRIRWPRSRFPTQPTVSGAASTRRGEYLHSGMLRQPEDLTVTEANATERDTVAKVLLRMRSAISAPWADSRSEVSLSSGGSFRPPHSPGSRVFGGHKDRAALPFPRTG